MITAEYRTVIAVTRLCGLELAAHWTRTLQAALQRDGAFRLVGRLALADLISLLPASWIQFHTVQASNGWKLI